jgi:uncharacterized membrane protein YgdD (TMEM256/DUF423 family)
MNQMNPRRWIAIGALCGALAVAAGAFGAHGLRDGFDAKQLEWWGTAVDHHFWSTPGLLVVGFLPPTRASRAAAWCLLPGLAVFSGTLYAMALGAPRWFGAITPIGGTLLIAGWLLLAWAARQPATQRG